MSSALRAVLSPCIGVCALDEDGLCEGCLRTTAEIACWSQMSDEQRLHLMENVLPLREQARLPFAQGLPETAHLRRALHPLHAVPRGDGWNHEELKDLLPSADWAEAAVLVGLVPRPQGSQVLLTRRNEALRHHAGQVSFPGGRMEAGDSGELAAALRETREEIGLPLEQIAPLGFLDPFSTISGFRVVPVVAVIDPDYVARPDPNEVAAVFEVPLDYLMAPANLRRADIEYRGRHRAVWEYDWPGQRIWGATAAILFNLRQRLERT